MIDTSRRNILKKGMFGLAALPFGMGALTQAAYAATMPMVDPSSAKAQSLSYTADASTATSHAKYQAGSNCANCQLFNMPVAGGCPLFAGSSVDANGWCQAWVKKA